MFSVVYESIYGICLSGAKCCESLSELVRGATISSRPSAVEQAEQVDELASVVIKSAQVHSFQQVGDLREYDQLSSVLIGKNVKILLPIIFQDEQKEQEISDVFYHDAIYELVKSRSSSPTESTALTAAEKVDTYKKSLFEANSIPVGFLDPIQEAQVIGVDSDYNHRIHEQVSLDTSFYYESIHSGYHSFYDRHRYPEFSYR